MPTQLPCLWFDGQAEQAAELYVSTFPNARITKTLRTPPGGPGPAGEVLTVEFSLDGHAYLGLNGGPQFTFSEAISFQILCEDQAEVDLYWERLAADGGEHGPCGWLKDRFGVSWQVVPKVLPTLLESSDAETCGRVMAAMMAMGKLDVAGLQAAAQATPV